VENEESNEEFAAFWHLKAASFLASGALSTRINYVWSYTVLLSLRLTQRIKF